MIRHLLNPQTWSSFARRFGLSVPDESVREPSRVEVLESRIAPATLTVTNLHGDTQTVDLGNGDSFALTTDIFGRLIASNSTGEVLWAQQGRMLDLVIDAGADDFAIKSTVRVADDFIITGTGDVKIGANALVRAGDEISIRGDSVVVRGELRAAHGGAGGDILITGEQVSLEGAANISVAAKQGGGTVLIGGDYQGANPSVENASQVFVGKNVRINANATQNGDGGKVIVWADDAEYFAGNITARGGRLGGNGGFVETSSSSLTAIGRVNVGAPAGVSGTWLVDPNNIRIGQGGDFNITSGATFFDSAGDDAFLSVASLNAALNAGGNLFITTKTNGANSQAGDIEIWDTITKSSGADSTVTFNAHRSVLFVNDGDTDAPALISTSNKLNVVISTNYDNDSSNGGFYMNFDAGNNIAATINTNGGDLTVGGQASPSTQPAIGPTDKGVYLDKATITTGAGNISIRGQGDAASGGGASIGIDITNNTSISTTSGNITLVGTGGGVSDNFSGGISMFSGSTVTTSTGAITLTGSTTSSGTNGFGIKIEQSAKVEATGNGTISLTGTGSSSGSGSANYGVALIDSGSVVGQGSGAISINGTGGANNSYGVFTTTGTNRIGQGVSGTFTGNIAILGSSIGLSNVTGGTTGTLRYDTNIANNEGVIALGTADFTGISTTFISTAAQTVWVSDAELDALSAGTYEIGNNSSNGRRIAVHQAITPTGNLSLMSDGYTVVEGVAGGSITLAADKNLTFDTGSSGSYGRFVYVYGNAVASGTGTITFNVSESVVVSNADVTSAAGAITLNAGNFTFTDASVTSTDGDIDLTISGRVQIVSNSVVESTGAGDITISGSAFGASGVGIEGGSRISVKTGDLTITGDGTTYSGYYGTYEGAGVEITSGAIVETTGSGAVNITGSGDNGIEVTNTGTIRGTAISSGAITLTGTTVSSGFTGIDLDATNSVQALGTNAIVVISDSISIDGSGAIAGGSNSVTVRQKTNGVAIDLGGTSNAPGGPLDLTDAELDRITAGTLNIGNANSGTITLSADISRASSTVVNLTGGAAINFTGGQLNSAGGNVTVNAGTTIGVAKSGADVTATSGALAFGSGDDLSIAINGTTVDTQYAQLNADANINLSGLDLVLSGGHTPVAGQTFTIVNNTGSGTTTGTFTGLAQGATIANFLGSSLSATISYTGGTGNDVVLTAFTPSTDTLAPTLNSGNLTIVDSDGVGKNNALSISISGSNLVITDATETFSSAPAGGTLSNGGKTLTIPLASVTGVLTFDGALGDDTLTINFSGGNPIPAGGISFAGGSGGNDELVVTGGTTTSVTHSFTNASDGSVTLAGALAGTITYTGLEPVTDNLDVADRVFTFTGGAETISLTDATGAFMTIDSTLGESVTFDNPTTSLTINATNGTDAVNITSMDADGPYAGSLTITSDGGDTVTISSGLPTLSSLSVSAATINLNSITTTGTQSFTGAVTLASSTTLSTTNSDVSFSSTIDGTSASTQSLTIAAGTGTITLGGAVGGGTSLANLTTTSGSAAFTLPAITLGGNLSITTSGGAIGQSGALTIAGTASVAAGAATITLTNSSNDFNGAVSLSNSGSNLVQLTTVDQVDLGTVTAGGDFTLISGDVVTDSGTITVPGTLTITAGSIPTPKDITLNSAANNFGTVAITRGNNVTLVDAGALALGASTVSGTLDVGTSGAITQSGVLSVTSTATFAAGSGNNITLNNASNTFNTVVVTSGNNATIADADAIVIGASTTSGSFTISTSGAITQTGGVSVGGTLTLGAGASNNITFNNASNAFSAVVVSSGSSVSLRSDGGFNMGSTTVGTLLTVQSAGTITQSVALGGTTALTKEGAGTFVLSAANTYGGVTTINGGTLQVDGSLNSSASTVTVNNTATLSGSGTVSRPVSVANGGTLSPGSSTAILTTNTVTFASSSTFTVEIDGTTAGTDYDQLSVVGSVTLTGASLSLSGTHTPSAGEQFTIIDNDGTDAITDVFTGLAEGASITNFLGSSLSAIITYTGGTGNDVVLTAYDPTAGTTLVFESGGTVTILDVGTASNDTITATINGANLRITDPSNTIDAGLGATQVDPNTVDIPLASITGVIAFDTGGGDDSVTLDLSNGDFIGASGLTYEGGPAGNDELVITGGAQGTVTYNYTNANDGSIVMSNFGTVSYTGLEPITNDGTATDIIFNLPAGPNTVTLGDDGTSGNTLSRLSGATFEQTDFANPSGSVTINRGNSSDTITINALPDFDASLTIGSGASPFSSITFSGAVTLAAGNSLTGDASGTISFSGASADLATSAAGTVTLTTARDITLASGSSISVVDGNVTLSANQQMTPTTGNFIGIDVNGGTITTSGTGAIVLMGRGGDNAATADLNGIRLTSAGLIQSTASGASAGAIALTGTGGAGSDNEQGIRIHGAISTVDGDITLTGTGGAASGQNNKGIHLFPTGSITSTGTGANAGNITLTGYGNSTTAGLFSDGVGLPGGTISSVDGDIGISGTSYLNNNVGIRLGVAGNPVTIQATGDGAITFTGIGSPTATLEDIYTQHAGNIFGAVGGTGGVTFNADTIDLSLGTVQNAGTVTIQPTTAATTISLAGSSTLDLTDAELDNITATNIVIGNGSSGAMTIGGSITRASSTNLTLNAGSNTVTFSGGGGIDAAGGTVTFNSGAITGSTGTEVTSSGGTLILNTSGAVSIDTAVANLGASTVSSGALSINNTGSLTVSGAVNFTSTLTLASSNTLTVGANLSKASGGAATATLQAANGVVFNTGTALTSTSGVMTVVLNGDTDANSAGPVVLNTGSSITSNGGSITIGGGADPSTTAAFGSAGVSDMGVRILGTLTSGAGNVSIRGTGLSGAGSASTGVEIATALSTTSGSITIVGTGGNSAFASPGVAITANVGSTAGGSVSITGTSTGSVGSSSGIRVAGASVTTTGAGTLTLSGTASTSAANNGVELSNGSVTSTGSGAITITGTGAGGSAGLATATGTNTIGGASYSGAITINADSVALANHNVQTTNTVTIQPVTATTTVSLNGASTLDLTTSELTGITASTLLLGSTSGTGAVTIGTTNISGTNYNFTLRGGATTFTGGLTLNSSKTATFNTAGITGSGATDVTSSGGTLVLNTTGAVDIDTALANLGASTITGGSVNVSNTGNFSVSGAVSFTSDLTVASSSTLTIAANLSKSSGGAATTTLQAANGVVFNAGTSLTSTSGAMAVVLNGDTDANSQGPVLLNTTTSITTNGGDVTIGGGANPATTAAFGSAGISEHGVRILGTITAGAGNVSIRGQSLAAPTAAAHGVDISTGSGVSGNNITIVGTGGSSATFATSGVNITKAVTSAGGNVSITGTTTGSLAGSSRGVFIQNTSVTTSGTGTIAIDGTVGGGNNSGVELNNGGNVTSTGSGAITIDGTGSGTGSGLLTGTGTNRIGFNGVTTYTGAVTITADTVVLANHNITTSGNTVTIKPDTLTTTVSLNGASTLDLTTSELTGISAATLIVGASGGTGAIGIGSAGQLALGGTNYNLTINGGPVTFSGAVSPILALSSAKTFTFNTSGITGVGGAISDISSTNGTLVLNTTGAVTMRTSVANLGASTISGGAVTVANTGALTVNGAVSASVPLSLSTINANSALTVAGNITTNSALTLATSTTTSDIVIGSGGLGDITSTAADITVNAGRTITVNESVTTTGSGNISFSGNSGAGARNIVVNSGGVVSAVNGTLSLDADQGAGVAGTFAGVSVDGTVSVTGTGTLTVVGRGGNTAGGNAGVLVQNGGDIIGGTAGTMTITGTGGANSGNGNYGVRVTGSGSTITSTGTNVGVTGTGAGTGASNNNHGVSVNDGGAIGAGGSGSVTVNGTGGAGTGGSNAGVFVGTNSATIASSGGTVIVNGTAGAGSSISIDVNDTTGSIAAGAGDATLTGASLNIAGAVTGANTTLIGDSMSIGGSANVNSTGTTTLRQSTNGNTINLGAADSAGVLGLTDAELDRVNGGTIAIGNANTGGIIVSAALTQGAKNFTFTTGGSISGAGSLAAGSLVASAATGITLSTALTTISASNSTSGNIVIAEADGITATSLTTSATNSSISLTTTNGAIAATGAVMATGTGTVTLSAGGTGAVSVASVTTGTGNISITSNNGSVSTTGAVNTGGTGQIALTAGGAGNTLTIGAGVSTGSGAIKFSADAMALNGAASSISSSGALSIEATTASTSIGLGAGSAGSLNLSGTEIATFADGFSSITIGNTAGSHTIDIDNNGTLTFNDPVTIRTGTAGGSISLASDTPLAGAGNASITLTSAGAATLDNSISTSNQPIAVNFGQVGGAVNITVGVLNAGASTATVTGGTGANIITLTSTANTMSVVGGGGSDTLVAPNTVNTWDLSANTLNTNVTHSGITTLQGGTSSDTFNINANRTQNLKGGSGTDSFVLFAGATLTGSVDGEAGTDTLDLSAVAVSVTLSGAGSVDGVAGTIAPASISAGFDNINVLNGSGTFTGANTTSTWTVGPTVTYTTGASTVTLTGYTTLQGGSAVDTFNVSNGHSISTINGGAGADIFNMDYSGGSPAIGLTVNGENDGDTLTLSGTTATTITHSFTNDTDGSVDVDGDVLNYTGMETTTDSLGAANRIFNFNGGAETISLTDATGANMTIDSTAASALTFGNPTTSLTINAGTGADTINITSMDAAYTGSLTVNGGADTDSVTLSSGLPILSALTVSTDALAALPALTIGAGGLNLTTTTSDITQSGALTVTGTTTLNSGANAITLTHVTNNFVGAVTATATGAGAISLNDASGGITIAAITALLSTGVTVTATGGGDVTIAGSISAPSAAATLNAADEIILNGSISADTLGLTAGTTITQNLGSITTTNAVTTNSSGDQSLTSTTNSIAALIATNTLAGGDISVQNGFDGFQIGPITNNDGPVTIDNTNNGVNDATIVSTVDSGGTAAGDISISTSGHLMVNAVATTAGGSGGALTLDGWLTLSATPVLGGGDITLSGGDGDLHILANLSFASSYTLSSQNNVIIEATVATTGSSSDLTITADTDLDGVGGVYVKEDGFVNSSRDVTITGSDLGTLAFPGEAIRIDLEGTLAVPVVQVQAVRNITMNSSSAAPANVTAIAGYVKNTNTGPTVGNIEFTGPVDIIDNTAYVQAGGAGSILFDSTLDSLGGYDLKLESTIGNINFFAAVGGTNSLGDVTVVNVGNLTASSTVTADSLTLTSVDGTATFNDLVTVLGASGNSFYMQGITLVADQVSAPGGGDILWEVENITLGDTVSGIGELTIRPMTTARTIGLNGSGLLNLDTTEIGQLQVGFSMITIGRTDGVGTITTNGASFIDNLTVLVPLGTMDIDGKLETTGVASSITIEAKTLNLDVDSALDNVIETVNGTVTIQNTAIVLQEDSKISTNSGALGGDVFLTATINGAFDMEIDALFGAAGGDVTLRGLASPSAVHQSIGGSTRLSSFTVQADDIDTAPHIYTSGSQVFNAQGVITTYGGAHYSFSGGDITYNGLVNPVENLRVTAVDVTFTGLVLNQSVSSYQLAGDLTSGSPLVTNLASTTDLFVGQQVIGKGFPDGVTIVSVGVSDITLSSPAPFTEAGAYLAFGSFGVTTLNASAPFGSNLFTLSGGNTAGLYVGQPVSGDGVPSGSTITSIVSSSAFTISANVTTFSVSASIAGSPLKATATSGTNSFTLNSGNTSGLIVGQAITGTYVQPGTVISMITGPTTFTTSLVTNSDSLSPRSGSNSNSAVSVTASGQVQFQANVGVDGSGVAMPLNYLQILDADLVSFAGEVRTLGAITLTADEINFDGGANTIDGSSIVITASPTVVDVVIGTAVEVLASPELELSADDLDALNPGVPLITIGAHGTAGTLAVEGPATFKSPTKLYGGSPGFGTLDINDTVSVTGTAALELNAKIIDLAADVSSDAGAIVFTSQHQHLTGKVTVSAPVTVSSISGDISFLAAVTVNDTLTVSTTQGNVSTTGTIISTNSSDFTMNVPNGDVTFAAIGNGKAPTRPGHVQINSGGTTTFNMVDVDSLATDAAGTTLFRSNVKSWTAPGISILDPLTIVNNLTISGKGAAGITFGDVVESAATPRILLINTVSGDVHAQDDIGAGNSFSKVSILSTSGDITTDGTVDAATIIFTGASITTNDTVTTTGSQAFTANGAGDVTLGTLSVGTTLKVTSKHDIIGTGNWVALAGRTTLKSTSTLAADQISVTGGGNNFLELHLTGRNATIVSDNTISIAGGKISRVGTNAGITDLTSINGDIVQVGPATFETWHLIATATNAGASIDFSTGNLRVSELGALTADVDITIVRGAPSTLKLKDSIIAGNDVVIVADYGISQANFDNDAGPNPINAGGRFLIYAFDASITNSLLTGITGAVQLTPFGTRYSEDPLATGNPANVPAGDYLIYFRA